MNFRGKKLLNWSLNNYLDYLKSSLKFVKVMPMQPLKYGLALPMGARMMSGNSDNHENFTKKVYLH